MAVKSFSSSWKKSLAHFTISVPKTQDQCMCGGWGMGGGGWGVGRSVDHEDS